jgi:hypothetical protein
MTPDRRVQYLRQINAVDVGNSIRFWGVALTALLSSLRDRFGD